MADAGDVIVVGAGMAGGAAALALARAGRHPILVDPGDGSWASPAGAGILGPRDIPAEVRPSFPVDRRLSDRRLLFLGASSSVSIDYQEGPGSEVGIPASFLRARTDPWLAGAAVAAGAERRSGPVDRLLIEGGRIVGVALGGTELRARLTILSDGPRALELAEGLAPGRPVAGPTEGTVSTERLALPAPTIEERFDLAPGAGCSLHALLGAVPPPTVASGFLLTHTDSVTVGVRIAGHVAPEAAGAMRAAFQAHPAVAPFLRGSVPLPGSARVLPSSTRRRAWAGPGWALAGDAAGLPDFHGAVLRGRNRAFRSGWIAGEEGARALTASSSGPIGLGGSYGRRLRSEGLGRRGPGDGDPLVGDARLHAAYPDLLAAALHRLMTETGGPKEPVTAALRGTRSSSGRSLGAIARDATGALRRL